MFILFISLLLWEHLSISNIEMIYGANKRICTLLNRAKNFSFLDVQVFMVGPNVTLSETPRLNTGHASLDIDLIELSKMKDGIVVIALY